MRTNKILAITIAILFIVHAIGSVAIAANSKDLKITDFKPFKLPPKFQEKYTESWDREHDIIGTAGVVRIMEVHYELPPKQGAYYNEITLKVWEWETHEQAVSLLTEEQGRYRPNDPRRNVMFAISNFYVIAKPISWSERKNEAIALIESVKEQVGYVEEIPEPTPDTPLIPIIDIDEECKTYVNEEYNFKFSYPDWEFLEPSEGSRGFGVTVTEKYSVGATMRRKCNPDYSDEELLNHMVQNFYSLHGGYEKTERKTTVDGFPAMEVMATDDKECLRYILVVRDSYAYMISCCQTKELINDEKANKLCSIVRTTFHFLDTPEPSAPTPTPAPKVIYTFSMDSRSGPTWTSHEGVSGGVGLFDTGIHVNSGDRIIIIADGSFWNGEVTVPNPDGFPDPPDPGYGETILPTIASNSLIGGIGQTTDEYFEALLDSGGTGVYGLGFVGSSFSGTAPISGTLFLAINDRPLGDNMGFLDVQVGGGPIPTPEPTPTPTPVPQSITDARRALYQNYGKCLNEYYWVERGNEMGMMFGDDFERSFTTPLGILETGAKEIIIGAYSSVETLTKAVTSGAGALNCWRMSAVLQLSRPTSLEWEEPEQRMLHILELIEEEKYEEAREEICNLRSVLTVWRDNVDTVDWTNVGFTETEGEANKKRAKNLLTAIIKFLDTEYSVLGGEVIPSPTPMPTPNGLGSEAVFAIAGLSAVAYLLRRRG